MKSADCVVPLVWLVGYLLLAGVVEYAVIRRAQPTCDRDAGHVITAGSLFAGFTLLAMGTHATWYSVLLWVALAAGSAALLCGSWRLHRKVEIRP
jgi:hypothetical protein